MIYYPFGVPVWLQSHYICVCLLIKSLVHGVSDGAFKTVAFCLKRKYKKNKCVSFKHCYDLIILIKVFLFHLMSLERLSWVSWVLCWCGFRWGFIVYYYYYYKSNVKRVKTDGSLHYDDG